MANDAIYDRGRAYISLLIKNELLLIFSEEAIPAIKDLIIESFNTKLTGVVYGDYNSVNPDTMLDLLREVLENYNYVDVAGESVYLICPTADDLIANGLEVIGLIMNGIPNTYYKVTSYEYDRLTSTVSPEGIDSYLVAEDSEHLGGINKDLLDKFEFSGSPPVNITEEATNYIRANMPIWIRRSVEKAQLSLKAFMSGDIRK